MMKLHVGIIPDGNRRWCRNNRVDVFDLVKMLHAMVCNVVREASWEVHENLKDVSAVSVYFLSKDNLTKRNDNTVHMIREVLAMLLDDVRASIFVAYSIQIRFVGEMELLPKDMLAMCKEIMARTDTGLFPITIGMAYDPIEDCRRLTTEGMERVHQDAVDLVLRSGGEMRSSGFFPLHTLYSEWVYTDKLFPDLTLQDVSNAIDVFKRRSRRFGA